MKVVVLSMAVVFTQGARAIVEGNHYKFTPSRRDVFLTSDK